MCSKLVAKHKVLRDTIGNGFVSKTYGSVQKDGMLIICIQGTWRHQLRQQFRNMRRPSTPKQQGQNKENRVQQGSEKVPATSRKRACANELQQDDTLSG